MILLTNDDGFQAKGLLALRGATQLAFPDESIIIVAPTQEQSQIGHRVTTDTPLEVHRQTDYFYTVAGTPADCVRVALFGLALEPALILSGINHGGNLGHDIPISGTVAAIREAAYHGISGIAFSQYLRNDIPVHWPASTRRVGNVLRELASQRNREDRAYSYNVNLPCLHREAAEPEHHLTIPSKHPLPVSFEKTEHGADENSHLFQYTGRYASRSSEPGSDVDCCFGGDISISRLDFIPAGIHH